MKYFAAYLLLKTGGNDSPTADDVSKVLAAAGVDCDSATCARVISELDGKDISELINSGKDRIFVGGGGTVNGLTGQ